MSVESIRPASALGLRAHAVDAEVVIASENADHRSIAAPGIVRGGVSATCIDGSYVLCCFFVWLLLVRQSQEEPRMGTEGHGWRRVEAFSLALGGVQDCLRR